MKTIELGHSTTIYGIPECWEELTEKQYVAICSFIIQLEYEAIDTDEFKHLCVYLFLNMRVSTKKLSHHEQFKILENLELLSRLMHFFFNEDKSINLNFTKQFIPQLTINEKTYTGHKECFQDMDFITFINVHQFYTNFYESKDVENIDNLCATLYKVDHHELLKTVAFEVKYGIFLWFEANMRWLSNNHLYGSLFKKKEDETDDSEPNPLGFFAILYDFSERGIFGDVEKTANAALFDVLSVLVNDKHKADQQEKLYKKHEKSS